MSAHKNLEKLRGESIGNQTMPWQDSGQLLLDANNIPLIMSIQTNQRWTSWYNGNVDESKLCEFTTESCPRVVKSQGLALECTTGDSDNPQPQTPADMIADCYVPCWIRHGMGLYMLAGNNPDQIVYKPRQLTNLSREDFDSDSEYFNAVNSQYDEAIKMQSTRGIDILATMDKKNAVPIIGATNSPDAYTVHLGGIANTDNLTPLTKEIYLVNEKPVDLDGSLKTGDRLYFKMMDTFYADNAGGYEIRIHAGTKNAAPGPLEFAAGTFESVVNLTAEYIYKAIVKNEEFIRIVQALLVLYITLYGAKFMLGMDNSQNIGTFLVHIFKVALLLQLISPSSWEFFYVYFFRIFTEGITGLLGLLASPFSAMQDPSSPWPALDRMLSNFFSHETWTKVGSLAFSHPFSGLFLIIAFIYAIMMFLAALVFALMSYIVAYVSMGILLILFPIFLLFIVIKKAKWVFDEWLKQMIAYSIEMILQFGAIGLFSMLIMMYMEKNLGYRICWMPIFGTQIHGSNALVPHGQAPAFLASMFKMGVFLPHVTDEKIDNFAVGVDPSTGEPIYETRYADAPYLDTVNDERDLKQFEKVKNERIYYLNPLDALPLIFCIYLVFMFIRHALPKLSSNLRGGIAGATDSAGILGGIFKNQITGFITGYKPSDRSNMTIGDKIVGSAGSSLSRKGLGIATLGASDAFGRGSKAANELQGGKRRGGLIGVGTALVGAYTSARNDLTTKGKDRTAEEAKAAEIEAQKLRKEKEELTQAEQAANTERADEELLTTAANERTSVTGSEATSTKLSPNEVRNLQITKDHASQMLRSNGFTPETVGSINDLPSQQLRDYYQQYLDAKGQLDSN